MTNFNHSFTAAFRSVASRRPTAAFRLSTFCIAAISSCLCVLFAGPYLHAGDAVPQFFRGLNLNGPPVTIDGHDWQGKQSNQYVCKDNSFASPGIALVPATDEARAAMIHSSRWGGNQVELTEIPEGEYTVFLYVWEDNIAEKFSIIVNNRLVESQYNSGAAGHWKRLGPWYTRSKNDRIIITSQGGAANFSGVELWKGRHDGIESAISEQELAFFEKRIRPVLVEKCYSCHSADADSLEGDLLVDSRAKIREVGISGAAVVPGDLDNSLLIRAIRFDDDDLQMPPDEKLSDAEIADFEKWVAIGAPDPRSSVTKHEGKKIDLTEAKKFWSFRPIQSPVLPEIKDAAWPINDIDRFVLAKLEERGLTPSKDSDRRALIRRATYDLTGLPPTPDETAAFLADESDYAFAKLVDRLLESPQYGERWGRHWLDVVRYADTAGDNSDFPIPEAHRYRDWVIDAFNNDVPYDEFVRDQLAGDLRSSDSEQQYFRRIIATGYIAGSRRFGSRVDDYPTHLTIEDTIDNVGRAFLGMTIACARCHDHKFDPITTKDYYGLYGVFNSTRYPWPGIELDQRQRDFVPLVKQKQRERSEAELAEWSNQRNRLNKTVKDLKESLKKASDDEKEELKKKLSDSEARLKSHEATQPQTELAYAVVDSHTITDVAVQIKGDPANIGDLVPRHFPAVMGGGELPEGFESSGRAELAEWILSAENPLPARVMANRLWQYHFGRGIVPTPNDFGKQGKPATHPDLLDYLATEFRNDGWSIKSMHRRIMLSRTYQQSSVRDAKAVSEDPSNEYLAGYPRRRLEAEAIRDTLLVLGGNLDSSPAGEHPFPPKNDWKFTQHNPFKEVYPSRHRSVYLMTQRIQRHPFLAIFDGADPSASTAARTSTTTPLQALYFLNDPFVHEQAGLVAQRLIRESSEFDQRVNQAIELNFSRQATVEDRSDAASFMERAEELLLAENVSIDAAELEAWSAWVRALFRLNEFVYLD
ncbi:PSD1 and planctomycete cytochrome C domain-containing protein [Rubripirellula amarantea]|uniref:PSD1 and planctomycete cytochrome C domain-containing protein n=1 Tax=Rubripirellula amarantea TaxID=2527999 RepID=UPI0011B7051D|nr:PSD1 and planctomycete cytochrome C domain-containing protein [Rubripirellula amarantea]